MILIPGDKYENIDIKAISLVRDNKVAMLKSFYRPKIDDKVIGRVVEVNPSNIIVDIGYINYATLPTKNINPNIKNIKEGDYLLCKVVTILKGNITLSAEKKLSKGYIYYLNPFKIPRLIGKNGSMLKMLKEKLGIKIVIGKNGYIYLSGDLDKIKKIIEAINIINENSQRKGLTEYLNKIL